MPEANYLERAHEWLAAACGHVGDEGIDLLRLTPDELSYLGADLEGMAEGFDEAGERLRALVELAPAGDTLDTVLIEVKLALDHACWHWRSAEEILARHDLWDPELTDPDIGDVVT